MLCATDEVWMKLCVTCRAVRCMAAWLFELAVFCKKTEAFHRDQHRLLHPCGMGRRGGLQLRHACRSCGMTLLCPTILTKRVRHGGNSPHACRMPASLDGRRRAWRDRLATHHPHVGLRAAGLGTVSSLKPALLS